MRKQAIFSVLGMNRDLAMSKFDARFAYENKNLRLITDKTTSKLVMTNEKGPKKLKIYFYNKQKNSYLPSNIIGTAIGTAVIDNHLVIFTHGGVNKATDTVNVYESNDYIYRIDFVDDSNYNVQGKLLYKGDLSFDTKYPIETLTFYETEDIQKVYWTDGINQPRMINIMANDSIISTWNNKSFDFSMEIDGHETIAVNRIDNTNGIFPSGIVQYAFTYHKLYAQESSIVRISPLYYISDTERGTSVEENVPCSFKIVLKNLKKEYKYVRLYSIIRTSENTTPLVKRIADLSINTDSITNKGCVTYIDNNTNGEDMASTDLLFMGSKNIVCQTITQKDNTMFIGNIVEKHKFISDALRTKLKYASYYGDNIGFINDKNISLNNLTGFYPYKNTLYKSSCEIKYFKCGETYRFGVQLQDKYGNWSDVIRIENENGGDFVNTLRPYNSLESAINNDTSNTVLNHYGSYYMKFATFHANMNTSDIKSELSDYVAIRPVVVYPDAQDESVIAQGVLCPTVYNLNDRVNNKILGQLSWFSRCLYNSDYLKERTWSPNNIESANKVTAQTQLEYRHYVPIPPTNEFKSRIHASDKNDGTFYASRAEIAVNFDGYIYNLNSNGAVEPRKTLDYSIWANVFPAKEKYLNVDKESTRALQLSSEFFVDQSVLSFHSPDLEYNTRLQSMSYDDVKMRIVGICPLTSTRQHVTLSLENADSTNPIVCYPSVETNNGTENYVLETGWSFDYGSCSSRYQITEYQGIYGVYSYEDNDNDNVAFGASWYGTMDIYPFHTKTLTYKNATEPGESINAIIADRDYDYNCGNVTGSSNVTISKKVYDTLRYSYNTIFDKGESLSYDIATPNIYITGNPETIRLNNVDYSPMKNMNFKVGTDSIIAPKVRSFKDASTYQNWFLPSGHGAGNMRLFHGNHIYKERNSPMLRSGNVVEMKYKSSTCAILQLDYTKDDTKYDVNILPKFGSLNDIAESKYFINSHDGSYPQNVAWADGVSSEWNRDFDLNAIGVESHFLWDNEKTIKKINQTDITDKFSFNIADFIKNAGFGYFYIAELYRDNVQNRFGGITEEAVSANVWTVCGREISLRNQNNELKSSVDIIWSEGDTYYQRYDNLHTYPYTEDDVNQIVDIMSFMCETRINIDGRYDKNRGLENNISIRPSSYALNGIYSQKDNYFQYRYLDHNKLNPTEYHNTISWGKTKQSGEITDTWTNITLANTLDLDGAKGPLRSLQRHFNDILAFQDTGISDILYNENYAVNTQNGIPLEIANSSKVTGKIYIAPNIGCKNKWSIVNSSYGTYFVDDGNKDIYLIDGQRQLHSIANDKGFRSWMREHSDMSHTWNVKDFTNIRSLYDRNNDELMFVTKDTALSFSEKINMFTSFYDYDNVPFLESVLGHNVMVKSYLQNVSINGNDDIDKTFLFEHNAGEYNSFFDIDSYKPYYIELICNNNGNDDNSLMDKTWTNVMFQMDFFDDNDVYIEKQRFDKLETWTEYQHGITTWNSLYPSVNKKFRLWHGDIPRDETHLRDRMRNPWIKIRLTKSNDLDKKYRSMLHSIGIEYLE